jgi:hypothetical protein
MYLFDFGKIKPKKVWDRKGQTTRKDDNVTRWSQDFVSCSVCL